MAQPGPNFGRIGLAHRVGPILSPLHNSGIKICNSPFAVLVKDGQHLPNSMPNIIFIFTKRFMNNVAHIMAKVTCFISYQIV